jgi:hypothetical protein
MKATKSAASVNLRPTGVATWIAGSVSVKAGWLDRRLAFAYLLIAD